jgi:hypothetical protein
MKLKNPIILFCISLAVLIPVSNLLAQTPQTKPTRQSSFEAYSQGNYEKAYTQFRELLLTYSKDPLYKYYSGVCLIKMKKDPGEAVSLLSEAVNGAGNIKTLPADGLYYLGQAQQMSGKFEAAIQSYNSYTERVGKKVSREMGIPGLIQECNQKKGQLADTPVKAVAEIKNERIDSTGIAKKPPVNEPVQKMPSKPVVTSGAKLPSDYEKVLAQAVEFQYKADSVTAVVNKQKKAVDNLSGNEKSALRVKILENEKTAAGFQSIADQKYKEAEAILNPKADSSATPKIPSGITEYKPPKDTIKKSDNPVNKTATKSTDTEKVIMPPTGAAVEVFSVFEVIAQPSTDPKARPIIDSKIPSGLIYRIQIGVFRNPVTPAYFKGLSPVYGFKIAGTDKTIYYIGAFRKNSEAVKALATAKTKGFKDAFLVALVDNKSVSPDRAAVMEKEWGTKPLFSIEKSASDTIPPTLTFRVEVMRSVKPVKEDVLAEIRKIAGDKGLDIVMLEDGKTDYLIGKFITFDTASEYSDLLKRNGYRDAQVVAWLGKKEIPIETARQLFDKLK